MARHLRTHLFGTLIASALAVSALASAKTPVLAQPAAVPTDFTPVVREKMPAVVAILTKQMIEDEARGLPDDRPQWLGQGATHCPLATPLQTPTFFPLSARIPARPGSGSTGAWEIFECREMAGGQGTKKRK
jgi:hypothetical protein